MDPTSQAQWIEFLTLALSRSFSPNWFMLNRVLHREQNSRIPPGRRLELEPLGWHVGSVKAKSPALDQAGFFINIIR